MSIELPQQRPAGPVSIARDLTLEGTANALIAVLFAAAGPVAIILSAGRGRLSEAELASFVFGAFFINGLLTIAFSALYRLPLAFFWTIPGTVLIGPALQGSSYPEIVGAYLSTGILMLVLGLTGVVRRVMGAVPMPIVMAMVAGVFLPFGLDLVRAFERNLAIAGPMTLTFIVLSAVPWLSRWLPPLIGALLAGCAAMAATGTLPAVGGTSVIAAPVLFLPAFSVGAMIELVVPLAIMVLVVQNGQGAAVLKAAGHDTPINACAAACGIVSLAAGAVGTVSTCLTGPSNAIITSSGARESHYASAVMVGIIALAVGLFSPLVTRALIGAPPAFLATLAGLAMLRVLQTAFITAFSGRFQLGGLVTFLVTVAAIPVLNIGAAFWGLVLGVAVSWLLERRDFTAAA